MLLCVVPSDASCINEGFMHAEERDVSKCPR